MNEEQESNKINREENKTCLELTNNRANENAASVENADNDPNLSHYNLKYNEELAIYAVKFSPTFMVLMLSRTTNFFILIVFLTNVYQNVHMIDGVGLSQTYCRGITTFVIAFDVTNDLLSPIAYGNKQYEQVGYYIQRCIILMTGLFIRIFYGLS